MESYKEKTLEQITELEIWYEDENNRGYLEQRKRDLDERDIAFIEEITIEIPDWVAEKKLEYLDE